MFIENPILQGVLFGLTLAVLVGPVFFALIKTSISKGYLYGVFMAIGISLSDFSLIVLSYFGTNSFIHEKDSQALLGFIGGIVLIIFGVFNMARKIRFRDLRPKEMVIKRTWIFKYLAQGFVLNITNPSVWIFWIGVVSIGQSNHGETKFGLFSFFISIIVTLLLTDLLKSYLANKIKPLIKPRTLLWMYRIVGIIMLLFGVIILIKSILIL